MDCEVTVNRHDMYISLYISQKSSGNGKDLLQIHVPTAWVGRNHTPVLRYYTCAVTQIGGGVGNHRQLSCVPIQWVTDMPTYNASRTYPV